MDLVSGSSLDLDDQKEIEVQAPNNYFLLKQPNQLGCFS